ncbi:putative G-protein coupled receptor Mth-like 10 isoform X2 [Lycorma delicatula]|uniref:putative G-protein coupled receptor Mth-like 10 isoform X2 n=1 Tax=Lycorma delicatula TaxID=130591 RepID=UPI003F5161FE
MYHKTVRIYVKPNIDFSLIILITTGLLVFMTEHASCSENNTDEEWSTSVFRKRCCSLEEFECDKKESPEMMECSNAAPVLLQPFHFEDDKFIIVNDTDKGSSPVLLQLYENRTYQNYCIGWMKEEETKYKVAIICMLHADFEEKSTFTLFATCLIFSSVFNLITLIVYFILPWLRDLQGKVIISLLISLSIGYSSLAYLQLNSVILSTFVCSLGGFMTYYWLFAAFCWLHISCFNIWRTVALQSNRYKFFKDRKRVFILYSLFGWGIPFIFLIFALITEYIIEGNEHSIRPHIGESMCWFQYNRDKWIFFYGPILILITVNIYYFVSVVRYIYVAQKKQTILNAASSNTLTNNDQYTNSMAARKQKKIIQRTLNKCKLYLKLFFAMGITFIFEIISSLYVSHFEHYDWKTLRRK